MSQTLYRKYRPKTFNELIGQNHIKITLQNELETDKVAHAYLFTGPRGLGKTTTARLLAKAVNCLNRKAGESEPCNCCESCESVNTGRAMDIIEIDAASHTGVENVRENIISGSRFTPTRQKFKVFIIDEVHMLSTPAFNALLKTLEEPPAHVIFILVSTEIHKIPQTIISRCQRFDFKKVSLNNLIFRLKEIIRQEKREVADEVLESVALRAEGCIRDAESLLGQILSLGEQKITADLAALVLPVSNFGTVLELAEYLFKKQPEPAINLINQLVEEGIDLSNFIIDLIEGLRKILLLKIGGQLASFSLDLEESLEKRARVLAKEEKLSEIIAIIGILINKKQEMKFSEIAQLPLELAVVEICSQGKEDKDFNKPDNDNLPPSQTNQVKENNQVNKVAGEEAKGYKGFTLKQIREGWGEVLAKVKEYNQALANTLKIHQPVEVKDDCLHFCFKYKFHQDKIFEIKNKRFLEQTLEEIFGKPLKLEAIAVADLPADMKNQLIKESEGEEKEIKGVLEAFGGQLVE